MLVQLPNDKPSMLWAKLKEDSLEDVRVFDVDEILDEVGEKELSWFNLEGEIQPLKRKSFYNLIRNLKNI